MFRVSKYNYKPSIVYCALLCILKHMTQMNGYSQQVHTDTQINRNLLDPFTVITHSRKMTRAIIVNKNTHGQQQYD